MWSFFSRDPTKDFAYEIGNKVPGLEEKSLWNLHEGKRKSNGELVSVFCFDVKNSSETQVQLAKASIKKIKTLRHPNILTYVDGLENEKVMYIVTEYVLPLETYIQENADKGRSNELAISWGLHQITKGLSFLVNDCNFIHNNICLSSVFVDKAGEWKLGGLDYMYPATGQESIPPVKILPALEKYDPPERAGPRKKAAEKWSTDSWGLGCLIWEVFNGTLPQTSSLKALGKIPKNLVPNYCELVGANPRARTNPAKFVENCCSKGGFMDNKFVESMLFLEEIQIKNPEEKATFFNSLTPELDSFPQLFCKHKILPQLMHAFEYGNAGSAVLAPMFKLGKCLDPAEYQEKVVPCIVKLFSSSDRATRVKLLQQIESFVEHLSPAIVNDKIFPNLIHGFNDTNPVVREQTIKGMMHLSSKLNYKNLNEELLKHFARLQTKDAQGGIRTNTTVCLGKIACYLNPQIRQKVLSSAYLRAMKDPFPPARQAAVLAMAATHNFFTVHESATKLLPALCTMALDPEVTVRNQVFKAIKCFLSKLEKVSDDPELITEIERDVKIGGSEVSSSGWTGWAVTGVSSLTSKFYKGKPQPAQQSSQKYSPEKPTEVASKTQTTSPPQKDRAVDSMTKDETSVQPQVEVEEVEDDNTGAEGDNWGDAGGWDDDADWGDMDDVSTKAGAEDGGVNGATDDWNNDDGEWGSIEDSAPSQAYSLSSKSAPQSASASNQQEQSLSPWGASDFTPVEASGVSSASAYNWGDTNSDDFFTSLVQDSTKKPAKSKLLMSSQGTSSTQQDSATKPQSQSQHKTSSSIRPQSAETRKSPSQTSQKTRTNAASKTSASTASKSMAGFETTDDSRSKDSGWGDDNDWGGDDWGDDAVFNKDKLKKQREEKKLQRQREMEQKRTARQSGGMKLGVKKHAKD